MLYAFWKKKRYLEEQAKSKESKFDIDAFLEERIVNFSTWKDEDKANIAYLVNYYGEESDNVRVMLEYATHKDAKEKFSSLSKALRAGKSGWNELRWFYEEDKKRQIEKRGCYCSKPANWPEIKINADSKNIGFEIVILATKLKKEGIKIRGVALDAIETPLGGVSIPILTEYNGEKVPVFLSISPYQGLGMGIVRTVLAIRSLKEYENARVVLYSAYPIPPKAMYILENTPGALFESYIARRLAKIEVNENVHKEVKKIVLEGVKRYFERYIEEFSKDEIDALDKLVCEIRRTESGLVLNLDTTIEAVGSYLGELIREKLREKLRLAWKLKENSDEKSSDENSISSYYLLCEDGKRVDPMQISKERFGGWLGRFKEIKFGEN